MLKFTKEILGEFIKAFREGLVPVKVTVNGKNKTFTRTYWTKPKIAQAIREGKIKSPSEYKEYRKKNFPRKEVTLSPERQAYLENAWNNGLSWKVSDNPAINWMRMKMAEKKANGQFTTKNISDDYFSANIDKVLAKVDELAKNKGSVLEEEDFDTLTDKSKQVLLRHYNKELAKWGIRQEGTKVNSQLANAYQNLYYLDDEEKSNIDKARDYISVDECKNFKTFKGYMQVKYGIYVDSSLENADFKEVKETTKGFEEFINEFPQILNDVSSFEMGSSFFSNRVMMSTNFKGDIDFYDNYFKKGSKLQSTLNKQHRLKHTISKTKKGLIAHELGHLLEAHLVKAKFSDKKEPEQQSIWFDGKVAKDVIKKAIKNVPPNTYPMLFDFDLQGAGRTISDYASTSPNECLAEAVADYFENRENAKPLSKEIWKILKKEIK